MREKINDPAYSGWFIAFKKGGAFPNGSYYVPPCTDGKCSDLYHDQDQTPRHPGQCIQECDCGDIPCGEYLWDHRNTSLRDYIIKEVVLGPLGLGNPHVDGFYFDDGWTNQASPILPWMPKEVWCMCGCVCVCVCLCVCVCVCVCLLSLPLSFFLNPSHPYTLTHTLTHPHSLPYRASATITSMVARPRWTCTASMTLA